MTRTEEAVEIYKRSWSEDVIDHVGTHYRFSGIRMDPKPIQAPRPRIYYGGVTRRGAQLAASCCDGFYPTFTDARADARRYRQVITELPSILEEVGRTPDDFSLLCVLSARIDAGAEGFGKGSVGKVLADLEALAEEGFSLVVLHLDTRNGELDEWQRQLHLFGEHVLSAADQMSSAGPWRAA